jgi:hypothetical protein
MRARGDACRRFHSRIISRSWYSEMRPDDEQKPHVSVRLPQVCDSLVTADSRRTEFAAFGGLRSTILPCDPYGPKLSRHKSANLTLLQQRQMFCSCSFCPWQAGTASGWTTHCQFIRIVEEEVLLRTDCR